MIQFIHLIVIKFLQLKGEMLPLEHFQRRGESMFEKYTKGSEKKESFTPLFFKTMCVCVLRSKGSKWLHKHFQEQAEITMWNYCFS